MALAFAAFGAWYSWFSWSTISGQEPDPKWPHFTRAYTGMLILCVSSYVVLAVVGVQLIRMRSRWSWVLAALMASEVVYFLVVSYFWSTDTEWAASVAAATGVANGGLMPQLVLLFPIWGPWLAVRAHRRVSS